MRLQFFVLSTLDYFASNKDIANLLNLTVYTVESHRSNLMEKLNLRGLPEVILYAVRNGIISQACTGLAAIQVV